jgi:hypothetical protein
MLISLAYSLTRKLIGVVDTVARRDVSKDAELLVLRHESAVLRRHVEKVCYRPEDRLWFAALSRLISRHRWAEAFPVTPGTLSAWHSKLVAGKVRTRPAGTPRDCGDGQDAGDPDGQRQPAVGASARARRADQARTLDRGKHRLADPA